MSGELGWYRELVIQFSDGKKTTVEIERRLTGTHVPIVRSPAEWTKLGYQKCPGCPIPGDLGWCPAALSLQATLDRLRDRTSIEMVTATATDDAGHKETITAPLQAVGAVLVQLAVFASECPVGRQLKPHMAGLSPFIDGNKLIQTLLERIIAAGGDAERMIKPLHEVFVHLLSRLSGRIESNADAIPNSVVRVDAIAQAVAFRAKRLNSELGAKLGWTASKKADEKPGLLGKIKGLFGS